MELVVRASISALMAIAACGGMLQSERLAHADRLAQTDILPSLELASRIEPANATYHSRIADFEPSRRNELDTALRLNPWNSSWWVRLAARQEEDGDLAAAERSLLRANSVCQCYTPRWMIAFYYYRLKNQPAFVTWGRAVLAAGAGETESILRMAQKIGLSPDRISRELVPDDPDKLAGYLEFLLSDQRTEETFAPAARLIALKARTRRNLVLDACQSLFSNGNAVEATSLWNKAVKAGWAPFHPLDPSEGRSLAREDFRGDRIEHGFDWRYSIPDGVSISTAEPDGSLRMEFSGSGPVEWLFVRQFVPLLPGRRYRLSFRYRVQSIVPDSGLQWSVVAIPGLNRLASLRFLHPGNQSAEESVVFETPRAVAPTELTLSYSRRPGTTKIEGTLWIESVKLTPVQ